MHTPDPSTPSLSVAFAAGPVAGLRGTSADSTAGLSFAALLRGDAGLEPTAQGDGGMAASTSEIAVTELPLLAGTGKPLPLAGDCCAAFAEDEDAKRLVPILDAPTGFEVSVAAPFVGSDPAAILAAIPMMRQSFSVSLTPSSSAPALAPDGPASSAAPSPTPSDATRVSVDKPADERLPVAAGPAAPATGKIEVSLAVAAPGVPQPALAAPVGNHPPILAQLAVTPPVMVQQGKTSAAATRADGARPSVPAMAASSVGSAPSGESAVHQQAGDTAVRGEPLREPIASVARDNAASPVAHVPVAAATPAEPRAASPSALPSPAGPTPLADPAATIAAIVERLAAAREAGLGTLASVAIAHREFGDVTVSFAQNGAKLEASLTAADRDNQQALATALSTSERVPARENPGPGATTGQPALASHQDRTGEGQGSRDPAQRQARDDTGAAPRRRVDDDASQSPAQSAAAAPGAIYV